MDINVNINKKSFYVILAVAILLYLSVIMMYLPIKFLPNQALTERLHELLPEILLSVGLALTTLAVFVMYNSFKIQQNRVQATEVGKRLEILIQVSFDAIITSDANGIIVGWNGGAEQIFGYARNEALGHPLSMLMPEMIRNGHKQGIERVLSDGQKHLIGKVVEMTGLHKDGKEFPLELSLSIWQLNEHNFSTAIIRNIYERKLVEESLRLSKAKAEEASRCKSEFLARMSHEMRTPLTSILGYTELLLSPEADPKEYPLYIRTIQNNGNYLLSLITDLLDLTEIESDTLHVNITQCSPRALIEEVASVMLHFAAQKKLSLEVFYEEPIPTYIYNDPKRITQVLYKLINNAIKYTKAGGVRVLVKTSKTDFKDSSLQISVIDTGIGIPKEVSQNLFQAFFQSPSKETHSRKGVGIGLAIAKKLVELLGGKLSYYSEPGFGSTFIATFATQLQHSFSDTHLTLQPDILTKDSVSQSINAISSTPTPEASLAMPKAIAQKRILLAEDNIDTQALMKLHLKHAGAEVDVADNGQEAYEKALAALKVDHLYDIILMDIEMPVMSGLEAIQRLRAVGYHSPIIALTAYATSEEADKCMAAGCNEVIVKPVANEILLQKLTSYCLKAMHNL